MTARGENATYGVGGLVLTGGLVWAGADSVTGEPDTGLDVFVAAMAFAGSGVTFLLSMVLLGVAARGGRRG